MARRKNFLEDLSQELKSDQFNFRCCDISDQKELLKALDEMENQNFNPDVIILNAGILMNEQTPIYDTDIFSKTMETNFHSPMLLVTIFLEKFLKRGHGHFIAMNSTSALRPNQKSLSYSASKSALALSFRKLHETFQLKNIPFSTVYLGPVDTSMWDGRKSFLVPKPEKVALHIEKIIKSKKEISYYPPLSTTLFRLGNYLPDIFFIKTKHWLLNKDADR